MWLWWFRRVMVDGFSRAEIFLKLRLQIYIYQLRYVYCTAQCMCITKSRLINI